MSKEIYWRLFREFVSIMLGAFFYLMMFVVLAGLAYILINRLHSAPLPVFKPKPPPVIQSGKWDMKWGGTPCPVTLDSNGSYKCEYNSYVWYGSWSWDAKTRTIHIHERMDSSREWLSWSAVLDNEFRGRAVLIENSFTDSPSRELCNVSFTAVISKKP